MEEDLTLCYACGTPLCLMKINKGSGKHKGCRCPYCNTRYFDLKHVDAIKKKHKKGINNEE